MLSNELLNQVIQVAEKAGRFLKNERKTFQKSSLEYKGKNDLVSYVDKQTESLIVHELNKLLPEAGVIGEEGSYVVKEGGYNWIVDPLDGTTNFIHGLPAYVVSIGLAKGNDLVLGVVFHVEMNQCFYAEKGKGAFCNGKQIEVSREPSLSSSLIATGFPFKEFDQMDDFLAALKDFLHQTHGVRRMGAAALDLAYVAMGVFEGFFEYNLKPWDVAAGALIVQEAGGQVTGFDGVEDFVFGKRIIASNKHVHQQVLAVVERR